MTRQPVQGKQDFDEKTEELTPVGFIEVFGLDLGQDPHNSELRYDFPIHVRRRSNAITPSVDHRYKLPKIETAALARGIEHRDRILIVGPTGVGKTSLVEQVAARLNYKLVKINLDRGITREHLIGEWTVKDGKTLFQYGPLVQAFQDPGTIILLDEWDTLNPDCAFVLQRPLQKDDGHIFIHETNELIRLHDQNVIIATANTNGQGDDAGLYSHGTSIQNFAQINRFSLTIRLNDFTEEEEIELIQKRVDIPKADAAKFVRAVQKVRQGFIKGEVSVPLTRRDLINWVEKSSIFADALEAARYAFLNRMLPSDAAVVEQILNRFLTRAKS